MALEKFGAPSLGSGSDALKASKLAQRVEKTLMTCLNAEPKQLDPRALLVAPANRDGASPNLQHVHRGILASLAKSGFDRTRPQAGICVQFKSSEGKAKLLEYNKRFSKGNELLPPIEDDKVLYGTLAGTHLNLALRILRHGVSSPACNVQDIVEEGSSLAEVVQHGHRWWILPESTSHAAQVEVSLWRNQDQNENQGSHEIEILRGIISTCEEMAVTRSKLPLGEILARAQHRSPARLGERVLSGLAKYFLKHIETSTTFLAQELQDFHSARINPKELCVPVIFFETLGKEQAFTSMPFFRHYAVLTNYTLEKTRAALGGASSSTFLDSKALEGIANKLELLRLVEGLLKTTREKYLPILERELAPNLARLEYFVYADLLLRCLFAKAFPQDLNCKVATGKLNEDKAHELGVFWASKVHQKYPDLDFPKEAGLLGEDLKDNSDSFQVINLSAVSPATKGQGGPPEGLGFKRGDEIKVIRRFSAAVPKAGSEEFRRDIQVGTSGIIQGFADDAHEHLLVAFNMKLPGKKDLNEVICTALPRNLVLAECFEALNEKGEHDTAEEPREQKKATALTPKGFQWLNGHLDEDLRTKVIIERQWDKLEDHTGALQRTWFLKAKVSVAMAALKESLPEFGPSDFVVCHRTRPKGPPITEVWTSRDFGAREIMVAPLTTEVKEGLWTKTSSVFLGMPQAGPGKHPEGKLLALDGRGRSSLSSAEVSDASEHRGNLFWVIQRTSEKSEANLVLEQMTWSASFSLGFASGKRRKAEVSWPSEDLPRLPLLTNPKAIKAHTRLILYIDAAAQKALQEKSSSSKQ